MKRVALLVTLLLFPVMLQAQPLPRGKVPQPLETWVDWALHGHEEERCPFFQGEAGRRECAWPSRLTLDAMDREGRFEQSWLLFADTWSRCRGTRVCGRSTCGWTERAPRWWHVTAIRPSC